MNMHYANPLKPIQLTIRSLGIHLLHNAFLELRLFAQFVEVLSWVHLAKYFRVWYNNSDGVGLV